MSSISNDKVSVAFIETGESEGLFVDGGRVYKESGAVKALRGEQGEREDEG